MCCTYQWCTKYADWAWCCRLCHFEGCFVTPTYNYPGQKKRIFCVTHKKEGMVRLESICKLGFRT